MHKGLTKLMNQLSGGLNHVPVNGVNQIVLHKDETRYHFIVSPKSNHNNKEGARLSKKPTSFSSTNFSG
ncbi:hypothetical protein B6D03_01525 [Gilliamella apicola]|nr:hypothetical protein B6D03_01525 [Gilliamella apicola]